jgi:poly(A) polymerase
MQNMPERLMPAIWLDAPSTRAVMAALQQDGEEARFVGGAVRNALLGLPVTDIDLAATGKPQDNLLRLAQAGIKTLPTGIAHGTITAITAERHFEITTLRRDVETDGRHAKVVFGNDWRADAQRRDFTLNTLYADQNGRLYDPLGSGYADLAAGHVRFVGDPVARIREDYLRILRFFRFFAAFEHSGVDSQGLAACILEKDGLARLSGERVQNELAKLFIAPRALDAIELMVKENIFSALLPVTTDLKRCCQLAKIEETLGRAPDFILRLSALLPDETGARRLAAERLRLSNRECDRLISMGRCDIRLHAKMSSQDIHLGVYRMGMDAFLDRVLICWAGDGHAPSFPDWRGQFEEARRWTKPVFPLSGRDLKEAGVEEGPELGKLLVKLEQEWAENDFRQTRPALLERLSALLGYSRA